MTQQDILNLKLSSSQLNKLKSAIKNETYVILKLSSNMIGNSDDATNFPGHNTTLIISNDEMKDILKIVKSFEDSVLLLEGVSEIIKNEPKRTKSKIS